MDRDEILAAIVNAIADQFFVPAEIINAQTTASDVDGWDSLSHVTLIMDIERRLNVRLPVKKTTEASDVGQLVQIAMEAVGSK